MKRFAARPRHPVTGRRFWLRARSARELEAFLHRLDSLRVELKLGVRSSEEIDRELRHLRHGPVTLERAAIAYVERAGLAANTRRGMRSALDTHFAALASRQLAALDAPTVAAWIHALERSGLASSSIGTLWRKLRAITRYALERGWIGASPWGSYKPGRIHGASGRALREAGRSVDELARLLEAAAAIDTAHEADDWPPMLEAKIAVAALLGLRQGELAGLRWTDVKFPPPAVEVIVARQWDDAPVKGKKPHRRQSIAELGEILSRQLYRLSRRDLFRVDGPVFPCPSRSAPGQPRAYLHGEVLTRLNLRAAVERARLPNFGSWSAHSLRDTFVTLEASASGGDLARVQLRSRHASVASLSRYLRALQRNHPAAPAITSLPGEAGAAGAPLLGPHKHEPLTE
jgi:integrase